ncbi:uncharacterized protein C16orf46 homolog [Microcaecilia unicolor]|uniref:Uncharacterized protein C16orf46 homolog n=1 Tax=Microcaecilia unicolor TaxID=1415580 RepID=A0A6P7Y5Y4_9AMPH|nr:uncharacterized protein C16orf46 homolog [Microcaecilia unicolor]
MNSCGEKDENQQEEIWWKNLHPSETGRNLVFSLLRISEKNSEEDENCMESVIGTGWEGAVQGWGRASPFACLQPPKKVRKARVGETVNNCLLCLDMVQVTDKNLTLEPRTTAPQSKPAGRSPAAAAVSSAQEDASAPTEGLPAETSKNTSVLVGPRKETHINKLSTNASQGEQKQAKEHSVWFQEKQKNIISPASLAYREIKKGLNLDSSVSSDNEESLLLNTFQILPPVGSVMSSDSSDTSLRKSKGVIQPQERGLGRALMENPSSGTMIKKHEQPSERGNAERRTDLSSKEIKVQEPTPGFASGIPRAPALRENEYFYWQCSFIPSKTGPTPSSAGIAKQNEHLAMKLQQARTAPKGQNMRLDEPKHHCSNNMRNEIKQRTKTKVEMNSLLSGPILPALTVTRVEIPVSSYRPL